MWRRYKKQHWYYRGATPASKRRARRWSLKDAIGQTRTTLVAHWRWTVVALALVIAGVTLSYMGTPSPDWTPSQLAVGTNPTPSSTDRSGSTATTQPLPPGVVPPAPAATPTPGTLTHLSALPRVAGLPFTGVAPTKAPVVAAATKAPAPTATAAKPVSTTATTKPRPTTATTQSPPNTTPPTTPVTDPPTTTTEDTDPPTTTTTEDTDPPTTTTEDTDPLPIDLPPLPLP